MSSTLKDYVKLHFIVLLWGFTAIIGLLIYIPSVELVFYRTLLSFLGLGVLLFIWKENVMIGAGELIKIFATGFLIAAHWILFFAAAKISTASVTLAGMATASLWTSILEPIIIKGKIKAHEVLLGLVVIAGLYVIFHFEFNHALGLGMAILSAFLAALFTVINGRFTLRQNSFVITFYEMIGACAGTALFFPIYTTYFTDELQLTPSLMDWFYIAILALVCTVYAYSASVELMLRMSAFSLNLVVNLEPVYGILLAYIIFGDAEKMTLGFYIGTFIILLAVLAYPYLNKYLTGSLFR
ncbi:MAG: DMT family transporter [Bacteroidota bacterium]|nr:DMT family transporter [Bacteroidota bacterium]